MQCNKLSLTVIVLTYNEELHLSRCLDSVMEISDRIVVVDSFSTDETIQIAKEKGADTYVNRWINYSVQFNWGLDNCDIQTDWVLRLDADEYLTPELILELKSILPSIPEDVSGIEIPIKRFFMGKHMKKGLGQIKMLRLFRYGKARIEDRWMDEHAEISSGRVWSSKFCFADHNLNNISWWIEKHKNYALREAIDLLIKAERISNEGVETKKLADNALSKRQYKNLYLKSPLFIRCLVYFIYRYVVRGGFRDGKIGFLWHFLQGFWYRVLVDTIIYETRLFTKENGGDVYMALRKLYDIQLREHHL